MKTYTLKVTMTPDEDGSIVLAPKATGLQLGVAM